MDHVLLKGLCVVPGLWNGQDLLCASPECRICSLLGNVCGVDGGEQARGDTKEPEQDNGGGCALEQGWVSGQRADPQDRLLRGWLEHSSRRLQVWAKGPDQHNSQQQPSHKINSALSAAAGMDAGNGQGVDGPSWMYDRVWECAAVLLSVHENTLAQE